MKKTGLSSPNLYPVKVGGEGHMLVVNVLICCPSLDLTLRVLLTELGLGLGI